MLRGEPPKPPKKVQTVPTPTTRPPIEEGSAERIADLRRQRIFSHALQQLNSLGGLSQAERALLNGGTLPTQSTPLSNSYSSKCV